MSFAILRHEKLKTWGQIANLQGHVDRTLPCKNADPTLSRNNFDLIAPTGDEEGLPLETVTRLRIGNQTIRKNAVLACDMILSVSPEYFRPDNSKEPFSYEEDRVKDWVEACKKWLLEKYGENRLLKVTVHLDEVTPHIHVFYVPFDEKGKLNAREFIGCSRWKMSELQSSYHDAIAHLGTGIERGKRKTKAKYQDIRQFYNDVNRSMEEKRRDWAIEIAQIALLSRLEEGKDIRGANYIVELKSTKLQIIGKDRGLLLEQDVTGGEPRISEALAEADLKFFKETENKRRSIKIQTKQKQEAVEAKKDGR